MSGRRSSRSSKKEDVGVFNQNQIAEFTETFSVFDKDGDGKVSTAEMVQLLNACGFNPPADDVTEFCSKMDQTGEGLFSLEEFMQVAEHYNYDDNLEEVVTTCLRVFFGKNRKMNVEHLKTILTTLGTPLTPDEIKHLMFNVNKEQEDSISLVDFVTTICTRPEEGEEEEEE